MSAPDDDMPGAAHEIAALRAQADFLIAQNEALRADLEICREEIVTLTRLLETAEAVRAPLLRRLLGRRR